MTVIRGELGLLDLVAIRSWNIRNNTARREYYSRPFASNIQNERYWIAVEFDPPVPDVDPRDPTPPYATRLLGETIKRKIRDGTELYDG